MRKLVLLCVLCSLAAVTHAELFVNGDMEAGAWAGGGSGNGGGGTGDDGAGDGIGGADRAIKNNVNHRLRR